MEEKEKADISDFSIYYQELLFQNEEMKRIMQENELLKQRYQRLYEDAPAGYVVYNHNGQIIAANNTLCRLLASPRRNARYTAFRGMFCLNFRMNCT